MLSAHSPHDGQPGFVLNPTRGVTSQDGVDGRIPLPPQNLEVFARDYQLPTMSTTMVGFQKQVGTVMAVDADLVYDRGWNMGSGRDPNLFYDPQTGYNRHPAQFGRPRPDVGNLFLYESHGRSDSLKLASSFSRRFHDNFQAGLTYTLMFFSRDTGIGDQGFGGWIDNHFDLPRNGQVGPAADFQRLTLRMNGVHDLP